MHGVDTCLLRLVGKWEGYLIFGRIANVVEKTLLNLESISETLLITLYARAVESQRPDAMIKDETAVALIRKLDCDFSRYKLQGHDEVALILRVREFDRRVREFLNRNTDAAVVHIGCGLDTRFERVDNGKVEWLVSLQGYFTTSWEDAHEGDRPPG